MKKEIITIKLQRPKIRNLQLMHDWQSGRLKTQIIPNKKKKKEKKFNWKQAIADYLNIKNFILVLK